MLRAAFAFIAVVVAISTYPLAPIEPPPPPPPPPPPTTADCSPGYYKNHFEAWEACFSPAQSALLLGQLSTRGPDGEAVRSAAKALIDACFVTASASPCTDDD